MRLSQRIMNIQPSSAVELDRVLAIMRANGEKIISFNAGQPDFETPQNIVNECNKALEQGKTKYTTINGIFELRDAVCNKLERDNGIKYSPEEIVITTGAKQALYNAMQVLLDEADEVIIPTPCWVSYTEMVKLAQGKPVLVKTKKDFHLDLDLIEKAITPSTKAIIINTPNNPTGAVYSKEELTELAEIALKNNLTIIVDEVYEKLIYDGCKHFSIASISDEVKAHCITINGLSKAYSMTGWRIGYLAAPKDVASAICSLQGHTTSNSTTFVQWAAIEALKGPQNSVETMRQEFNKRRQFVCDRLNKIEGVKLVVPNGAFYVFPDFSSFFGKKTPDGKIINNSEDLCAFILKDAKVAILPGTAFANSDCIRIAYANSMQNLMDGFDAIEASLSKVK